MIQLKRTTSGDISGLEYGQLGVTYNSGVAKLYVGDSSNRPVEVTTNLPKPYNLDSIKPGTNSDGLFWSENSGAGLSGTYRWSLYSSTQFDMHSSLVRIYSGSNKMTGYFGSYVQLRDEDNSGSISLNQGVRLGSSNQPIQLFALAGDISMQANEISLTSVDGPVNIQSSNSSQITMTTPQLLLTTVAALPVDKAITIQSPYSVLVSAMKFKCDTYPLEDDDVATKKYIDDQCYSPGDVLTLQEMHVNGEITGANKDLYVTFFLDKPIKNVSNAIITQGKLQIRQNNKYIFGTSSGGADILGFVDINWTIINNNALTIRLQYSNNTGTKVAWPDSTNNTAVQTIWTGNTKIQLS